MEIALSIKNVSVVYSHGVNKEKIAIDDISLEIEKGKILGLLGPNGAGKTTLIKSIMGLIGAKKGQVLFFGNPSSISTKRIIGYMPEIANFYWFLNPKEILRMLGRLSGMSSKDLASRIGVVLGMVGLLEDAQKVVKSFSKGMSERLNMAQSILHNPQILILDEPFSGLDPLGRIQMRNILSALKKDGKTMLLSSHELSEAELICDDICIMKNGKVLKHGPLAKILEERADKSLEKYFLQIIGEENA